MPTNHDIAKAATLRPIEDIAAQLNLTADGIEPRGRGMAKIAQSALHGEPRADAKLALVVAMTPTPHGEGKTTTTIGLTQGLQKIGKQAISCTREPALGPIFGVKGGAAGGGYSQVLPMEEINLFFTGDFPAISAAHNLLAAMLDAHIQSGNAAGLDVRQSMWPRTVDMNDRALRQIVIGLGAKNGVPREDGFVITPASEVMAIHGLCRGIGDLKEKLGSVLVGRKSDKSPVYAREIGAVGAMALLLRDAIRPNLVQTIEGGPALIHGGPFANIAHGTNSVVATRFALSRAEWTVTEAGFAADLGGQKFMQLVAPRLGKRPDVIVMVVTVRALKHHGEGDLSIGLGNLRRHVEHLNLYQTPIVVSINKFVSDTEEEFVRISNECEALGVKCVVADPWGSGGAGCAELASLVVAQSQTPAGTTGIVTDGMTLTEQVEAIAKHAYGADGVDYEGDALDALKWLKKHGLDRLLVCMAKTQSSLSDDPSKLGAPTGFRIRVRDFKPSLGAGFVVALAGEIMLMPGLGKEPAALKMDVDEDGVASGMF